MKLAVVILTLSLWISVPLAAQEPLPIAKANRLEIRQATADGNAIAVHPGNAVDLGSGPRNIDFEFGYSAASEKTPVRIRYKLEGYENDWHDGGCEMVLAVRFFNGAGDQVHQNMFRVSGESAGWNGSMNTSPLTHRRETLVVPAEAERIWVSVSSAGSPAAVGAYVVTDLTVSSVAGESAPTLLIRSPFDNPDHRQSGYASDETPAGWTRDGNHASMAKIVRLGRDSARQGFAIIDDDPISHAEWRTTKEEAPAVTPGNHLVMEWNEMYSMGVGDFRTIHYANLPPGTFRLRVIGVDATGVSIGTAASLTVYVPPPFWKRPWVWGVAFIVITAGLTGLSRYWVWRKMRREMARLEAQQVLQQERLRIAHDIHDDLGARVTQISLVSAMAQNDPACPEEARAQFDQISKMSRELVFALYGTVWAVNPENDNLEALGNYLCQMVGQLCEFAQFRCRFHLSDLPREVRVSSQVRHNICMAVKEAVHNAIKHAQASEVCLYVTFKDTLLSVLVKDDGRGFQPASVHTGNGLVNMKQRLESIGGQCAVEHDSSGGTSIRLSLMVHANHFDQSDPQLVEKSMPL